MSEKIAELENKIITITNCSEDDIKYIRKQIRFYFINSRRDVDLNQVYYLMDKIYKRIWERGETIFQAVQEVLYPCTI